MKRFQKTRTLLGRVIRRMRHRGRVNFSGEDDELDREYRRVCFSYPSDDTRIAHLERIIHETVEDAQMIAAQLVGLGFHQHCVPIINAYGNERQLFIYTRDRQDLTQILLDCSLKTGKTDVHLYEIRATQLYRWLEAMRYARMPPDRYEPAKKGVLIGAYAGFVGAGFIDYLARHAIDGYDVPQSVPLIVTGIAAAAGMASGLVKSSRWPALIAHGDAAVEMIARTQHL